MRIIKPGAIEFAVSSRNNTVLISGIPKMHAGAEILC